MARESRKVVIRTEDLQPATKAAAPVKETYSVYANCDNCPWKGDVAILKGCPIKMGEPINLLAICPDCGCTSLIRREKQQAPPAVNPLEVVEFMRNYDRIREEEERPCRQGGAGNLRRIEQQDARGAAIGNPVPYYRPPRYTPWVDPHSWDSWSIGTLPPQTTSSSTKGL